MRVHQSNKLGFAVSFFVQLRREPDEIRKKEKGKIGGGGDQGQGKGQRLIGIFKPDSPSYRGLKEQDELFCAPTILPSMREIGERLLRDC